MIEWQWQSFAQLTAHQLYDILALRSDVFVIEQNCVYQDIDGLDFDSMHLLGWQQLDGKAQLVAYLRCLPPGLKFTEASLGRVVTHAAARRSGAGRALLAEGLRRMQAHYGNGPIRIGAQLYLQKFYESFGFVQDSEPYDEDGILHIDMLRQ